VVHGGKPLGGNPWRKRVRHPLLKLRKALKGLFERRGGITKGGKGEPG